MSQQTYYDILGISPTAETAVIHAAYHALSKKYANPSADTAHMASILRQAYEVLSDAKKRADYDAWLRQQSAQQGSANAAPPPINPYQSPNPYASTNDNKPSGITSYRTANRSDKLVAFWLVGIVLVLIIAAVAMAAYLFLSQDTTTDDEPVAPIATEQLAPSEPPPLMPVEPTVSVPTISPEQQNAYTQAHADYLAAVRRINAVWNSLPKSTKDALRTEQRAINANREAFCQSQAASQYTADIDIKTARYYCEVPQLDARTEELKVYAATVNARPSSITPEYQIDDTPSYQAPSNDPVDNTTPAEARALYDDAVANINAIWNSLPDDIKDELRAEQRAINSDRESRCKAYAKAAYTSRQDQSVARYLCEVPELDSRAIELQEYY
ncbi:DnaJ domain-containing protein [Moraxella sp. ZJ142]|uniref:DnaJ domain-containing protein n=1 Tax=Moraxella marmotae TaxID=3344520 RepID=UPI0035D413CC